MFSKPGSFLLTIVFLLFVSVPCKCQSINDIDVQTQLKRGQPKLDNGNGDEVSVKFKKIQESFFKVIKNASAVEGDIRSFQQLLQLLDSEAGKELGRLFLQGVMLGATHKNSDQLLLNFWDELQERVSPEFADAMVDYKDFFNGMDMFTLYSTWTKLFETNELGNSLANLPLGQLVDFVQPAASKYGINIKGVIDGILGGDGSNFPDLFAKVIENFDATYLMNLYLGLNAASETKHIKKIDTETTKPVLKKLESPKPVKRNNLGPLLLFKPFLANMLRDNNIDLDADAVLKVLAPLINNGGDMMKTIAPLISSLIGGNKGSGGGGDLMTSILPLMTSMMGGTGDKSNGNSSPLQAILPLLSKLGSMGSNINNDDLKKNSNKKDAGNPKLSSKQHGQNLEINNKRHDSKLQKEPDVLSGFGSLIGALANDGDNNGFKSMALMQMASKFLSNVEQQNDPKEYEKNEKPALQLSLETVAAIAAKLATSGEPTADLLMKAASVLAKGPEEKKDIEPVSMKPPQNIKNLPKKVYLTEALQPILMSINRDQKCQKKMFEAITFGKAVLAKKMVGFGDLAKIFRTWYSSVSKNNVVSSLVNDIDIDDIFKIFSYTKTDWFEFSEKLENIEFRKIVIKTVAPHIAEFLHLLSRESVQRSLYSVAAPQINEILNSWGMRGLSLENFPARIGPLLNLMSRGWDLPFNVVSLLNPLKNQVMDLKDLVFKGLKYSAEMSRPQLVQYIETKMENEVLPGVIVAARIFKTVGIKTSCLPIILCQTLAQENEDHHKLKGIITRIASFGFSIVGASKPNDYIVIMRTVQAILINDECQKHFPEDCGALKRKLSNNNKITNTHQDSPKTSGQKHEIHTEF